MTETKNPSIPPPDHLFTWVDVDQHLALLATNDEWPDWLWSADCWWDGLELDVEPGTAREQVGDWLNAAFGPGSAEVRDGELMLRLDDPSTAAFTGIPVSSIAGSAADSAPRRPPLLRERRITRHLAEPLGRPGRDSLPGDVQLIALHSFKGGVGRTVHAVAVADVLAKRGSNVLLVDADLEAPGITWMHRSQGGPIDFSYEDLIALLQGSTEQDRASVLRIATEYLPNQQVGHHSGGGSLTIMPATRREELSPPRIEPADLLAPSRSRYFLTESLAELAAQLGADTVVIDLRAGASEISAPILLDPRVQRIFVTTLSHQSRVGTQNLIRQLGTKAPAVQGTDPASSVIITQYRNDVHSAQAEAACEDLATALDSALVFPSENDNTGAVDTGIFARPVLSPFHEDLLALPSSWEAVLQLLDRCRVCDAVEEIVPIPAPAPDTAMTSTRELTYEALRDNLHKNAESLAYAEERWGTSSPSDFLVTDQLRKLVGDHRTEPPIALVAGAKGAGKTFLHSKVCAARRWSAFAVRSEVDGVRLDAPVVPVLEARHLEHDDLGPQDLRDDFAATHGSADRAGSAQEIRSRIKHGIQSLHPSDELGWRHLWLQCIASAAGVDTEDAENALVELGKQHRAVFVMDGLEDLLRSLDLDAQRTALRVLVTDVLDWLRSLRGKPFGLIVFVRKDLVNKAVPQNSEQLLNRYKAYALRWNHEEALRLALWVAKYAEAYPDADFTADITEMSQERLAEALIPVWGWKLGTNRSKEARSHLWVPAALADFHNQVQARDIVGFLAEAAQLSLQDQSRTDWDDRVLAPTAMRKALQKCSETKIREIHQENEAVGDLLQRLMQVQSTVNVPFRLDEVGLDQGEADFLIQSGVFKYTKDGRYRVAEIYRHGLGIRLRSPGEGPVISDSWFRR